MGFKDAVLLKLVPVGSVHRFDFENVLASPVFKITDTISVAAYMPVQPAARMLPPTKLVLLPYAQVGTLLQIVDNPVFDPVTCKEYTLQLWVRFRVGKPAQRERKLGNTFSASHRRTDVLPCLASFFASISFVDSFKQPFDLRVFFHLKRYLVVWNVARCVGVRTLFSLESVVHFLTRRAIVRVVFHVDTDCLPFEPRNLWRTVAIMPKVQK